MTVYVIDSFFGRAKRRECRKTNKAEFKLLIPRVQLYDTRGLTMFMMKQE